MYKQARSLEWRRKLRVSHRLISKIAAIRCKDHPIFQIARHHCLLSKGLGTGSKSKMETQDLQQLFLKRIIGGHQTTLFVIVLQETA